METLRCEYRIVGALSGTLSQFPLQNTFYGLPLLLLPEQVEFIVRRGWAQLVSKDPNTLCTSPLFDDLWSKGYFITSGIKFGGDYLLYHQDPMSTHSQFVVAQHPSEQLITPLDIIQKGRLATNVKKTHVLAGTIKDAMTYYSIEWAGF